MSTISAADVVALGITALALPAAVAVLFGRRSWRVAVAVFAEMLTAAGLVRLRADVSWTAVAAAAVIVAVRRLIATSLLHGRPELPSHRKPSPHRHRPHRT